MKPAIAIVAGICLLLLSTTPAGAQKLAKDAEGYARTLRTDKDPDKRIRAAQELANIAKVKVTFVQAHSGALLDAVKQDADAGVRAAAGNVLLVIEVDPKDVEPVVLGVLKNDKEPGAALAICARLAGKYKLNDALPLIQALKDREDAKDDPKQRDQRLYQAILQALRDLK